MAINRESVSDKPDTRSAMIFSMITGSLYIILGLLQLSAGLGRILMGPNTHIPFTDVLFIPADTIGAFVLLLIGTVFIYGVMEMRQGVYEGVSYAYVGVLIALIFATIYMLVSTGNMLEAYVIKNEDYIGWTPLSDLRPGIYLALLPLLAFSKWKDMFEGGLLK
ncbi:hypothetical protein [Methanolobus sp. ZRKC5]|uniref:hypothetical protein n=1 Tax=unclassified Methanolobus TaxID=2629569 RepID=UPI00313E42FC